LGGLILFDITSNDSARFDKAGKRKTILVAGGAGMVGSNLIERLLDLGHRVICLDNLQTGDFSNVAPFLANPNYNFIRHDVVRPMKIGGPIDEIYDLACAASPPRYQKDPIHTFRTCTDGAINMLTLAKAKGARILLSSTSEVYGDPTISLQSEDYRGNVNTCGPRACYDEGKRAAETLFWEFGAHQGVETRIARIFNTYGPRMHPDDGRVVSNFIMQALRGEDLTIYGDGMQTRSFCYVDDLVDGLMRLMASNEKMPVNLGNPGEFTMLELAEQVIAKTGAKAQLIYKPLPQDDPRQRRPDISRAAAVLGWAPTVSLDQGLDRTIAWFAAGLGAKASQSAMVS
jgi:UDP-glucuronate decarboxylase